LQSEGFFESGELVSMKYDSQFGIEVAEQNLAKLMVSLSDETFRHLAFEARNRGINHSRATQSCDGTRMDQTQ